MGSLFKKPTCPSCGRKMVVVHYTGRGPHCRPCVCAPRPKVPVGVNPGRRDLLTADERADVNTARWDLREYGQTTSPMQRALLAIIDRLAPEPRK